MSYVPPLDASTPVRPRLPRQFDVTEIRVLGSLMEKQLATPEYYPLTLNALVAACNQKSNREPAMELGEDQIRGALERLQDEKFVWKVLGGRAVRFDQNLDTVWHLNRMEKAILALLFLRGPQTSGELRGRSDRLHEFAAIDEVEHVLREMAAHSEPLVRELPRKPGQKEQRWTHTAGEGAPDVDVAPQNVDQETSAREPLSIRVARLEERIDGLQSELRALKAKLGEV